MTDFLIKLITAHTGVSSKRVCGIIGWLTCLIITIYCTIKNKQATEVKGVIQICYM